MGNLSVKRSDGVLARIVTYPTGPTFDYYVVVEMAGVVKLKLWIYTRETDEDKPGFFKPKWQNNNELLIRVPSQQTEISVYINEGRATTRHMMRHVVSPLELSSGRYLAEHWLLT